MQPWSLFYGPFGGGIAREHDWRRVCDLGHVKDGCRIYHPLLCFACHCLSHPLFFQEFSRFQNLLNVGLEEFDELPSMACHVRDGRSVGQFVGECLEVLIWGEVWQLAMLWKQFRRTRESVCPCLGDVI